MKKFIFILSLLTFSFSNLFGQNKEIKKAEKTQVKSNTSSPLQDFFVNKNINSEEFEFVLHGSVKNGEGKLLKLTIPSKYPNETIISEIKDGHYSFKGNLSAVEKVGLSVVNKESNKRIPTRLFLTKDTIVLNLELGEQFDELTFISDTILKNDYNIYARKFDKKYWKINNAWSFNDNVKNDSMRKYIYPNIKSKTLELIEKELNKKEYSAIKLDYLRTIFDNNPIYNFNDLSLSDKKRVINLFNQTDSSLKNTPDYNIVKNYISKLNSTPSLLIFKDYSLIDINGNEITLSEIISNNKFTVIDFWWSGCLPCRKFNKEVKQYYNQLKEKGIEIVAINVDMQNSTWKNSSSKDKIEWVNLYAGKDTTILLDYNITSFPTKIIFDRNKKIIDFDFQTTEELLLLSTEK